MRYVPAVSGPSYRRNVQDAIAAYASAAIGLLLEAEPCSTQSSIHVEEEADTLSHRAAYPMWLHDVPVCVSCRGIRWRWQRRRGEQ